MKFSNRVLLAMMLIGGTSRLTVCAIAPTINMAYDHQFDAAKVWIDQHTNEDNKVLKGMLEDHLVELCSDRDSVIRHCYPLALWTIPLVFFGIKSRVKQEAYYRLWLISISTYTIPIDPLFLKKCLWVVGGGLLVSVQIMLYILGYVTNKQYVETHGDKQISRVEELLTVLTNKMDECSIIS